MGVFVWTLDDIITVVGIGIVLLMWVGLFVVAVVTGIGERILRRGGKSDEQKEETHENNTGTT